MEETTEQAEKISEKDTTYHERMVTRLATCRQQVVFAQQQFERAAGAIEVWYTEYAIEEYHLDLQAGDQINTDGVIVRGKREENGSSN